MYRDRWAYINREAKRLLVLLYPGHGYPGVRIELTPDMQGCEFRGHPSQALEVWLEYGVFYESGPVHKLAQPFLEHVASVMGCEAKELWERWERGRQEGQTTAVANKPLSDSGFPKTTEELAASWTMLDKGGLHARSSVMIHRALSGMQFGYVEASCNGRTVRTGGKPAFWLKLLSLEARRNQTVTFEVGAESLEQADAVLEAVADVLGRPKLNRHDYWKMLGPQGFDEVYFQELRTPEAASLRKQFRLFGKAQEDPLPPPEEGTPSGFRE